MHVSTDTLFLSSNKLTGQIPDFESPALRGLYLSDNELEGILPESLCGLNNLNKLFLDDNRLSGSIPVCFEQLSNLEQLYLFGNLLTGQVPSELSTLQELRKYLACASAAARLVSSPATRTHINLSLIVSYR